VYPPRFHYEAPHTLEEACQMMAYYREEAKVLSGGMSLIPLMKLRFASPSTIVDINNIPGLDYIADAAGYLRIGALARNRDVARSELVRSLHPLVSSAAPLISDPVVRNRGTLVGNCCHADPQGDWATVMLCLDGDIVAVSVRGERVIPIQEFIVGPFQNSLQPDEIAIEARLPGSTNYGLYRKIERKVGDFATVGVGVALTVNGGTVQRAGIALTGVGPSNIKCANAERMLMSGRQRYEGFVDTVAEMAAATASPRTDHRGSAEYKREMVTVFVRRALSEVEGFAPGPAPRGINGSGTNGQGTNGQGTNAQGTNGSGINAQGVNRPAVPPSQPTRPAAVGAGTPLAPAARPGRIPSLLQSLKRTFRRHSN
jgi:aerobic carbon-monoxide dehydrogenase medium subunit